TRSKRDWSSDVCSSDLIKEIPAIIIFFFALPFFLNTETMATIGNIINPKKPKSAKNVNIPITPLPLLPDYNRNEFTSKNPFLSSSIYYNRKISNWKLENDLSIKPEMN